MSTLLIVVEQKDGKFRSASLNAVTFAKKLAEVRGGMDLAAVVIGRGAAEAAKSVTGFGLTRIVTADAPQLANYMAESYADIVVNVAKSMGATVVTATATAFGKDVMPRVAALLDCGMVSEAMAIVGPQQFKRPMMAGNVIGTVEVTTSTMVATLRQSEWSPAQPTGGTTPIETISVSSVNTCGSMVEKMVEVKSERPELTDARIVVSGGRGMQNGENFKHLEKLADLLGGAMGATRAACDAGFVPNDLQVGQTGKIVAPNLYIAVGISGAIQHLAGMKGSKVIVAINKNPDEPIFQVADYGLVAKWEDTIPELTQKLGAIVGK